MPAPQRNCRRLKARLEPACIPNEEVPVRPEKAGSSRRSFYRNSIAGEFAGHSNIGGGKTIAKIEEASRFLDDGIPHPAPIPDKLRYTTLQLRFSGDDGYVMASILPAHSLG